MSKLQSFRMFITERLTAAAVEIFEAVEKTVDEYQEENERLRRMLRITPEIKLSRIDSLQFSLSEQEVPPEQQHCEQEWSPSLGQEDPEPTQIKEEQEGLRTSQEEEQIKEEQEELRTSQEKEQLQGLLDTKDSILTPPSVKSECDQENPFWPLTEAKTQAEENRESKNHNHTISHISTNKQLPTTCELTCTGKKPLRCGASKINKNKISLITHKPIHTEEITFRCDDCGKILSSKYSLDRHKYVHTDEKPFSCGECVKTFIYKKSFNRHKQTHTGETPFICSDCGKIYRHNVSLTIHKLTHTGEKPFRCYCGKRFGRKDVLRDHQRSHTGEKPHHCGECERRFTLRGDLRKHVLTHERKHRHSCSHCDKTFIRRIALLRHLNKFHNE